MIYMNADAMLEGTRMGLARIGNTGFRNVHDSGNSGDDGNPCSSGSLPLHNAQ